MNPVSRHPSEIPSLFEQEEEPPSTRMLADTGFTGLAQPTPAAGGLAADHEAEQVDADDLQPGGDGEGRG